MTRGGPSSPPHSGLQMSQRHAKEHYSNIVVPNNSPHPSHPPSPTFPLFEELPLPNLINHLDPNTLTGQHLISNRAASKEIEREEMADPFEVRMRFTSQLQHLNASVTSAQKAAHYALKHREMDEDLHSCILEQLERVSQSTIFLSNPSLPLTYCCIQNNMNNRANIMYFFEALCDRARHEAHPEFIRMMERDILRIIDLVAPDDGSGAANVKVVRKVLHSLQAKSYLNPQTVVELEDCIKDRDQIAGVHVAEGEEDDGKGRRHDKRQIEQRIEEDRERHKRLRESIWAVEPEGDHEFLRMLDDTSDVGDDDYIMAAEEADEKVRCAESHRLDMITS